LVARNQAVNRPDLLADERRRSRELQPAILELPLAAVGKHQRAHDRNGVLVGRVGETGGDVRGNGDGRRRFTIRKLPDALFKLLLHLPLSRRKFSEDRSEKEGRVGSNAFLERRALEDEVENRDFEVCASCKERISSPADKIQQQDPSELRTSRDD